MKTAVKSFVCSSFGFALTLCFAVTTAGQDTNRLVTGGQYDIKPPPTNMMFKITNNETNAGDDNLVWSHSGRMLAVDRNDPTAPMPPKYICLLDVRNLGNVQIIGARSSAATNPMYLNITDWTWNDDRVIFGSQPQAGPPQKVKLVSCTVTGPISVVPFFRSDPQENPTNHVYSPSVVLDPGVNKERLLCLVSSAQNNMPTDDNPATRVNLFTAAFDHGGVPNWADRVQLTAFNTNVPIVSAKWCPELGTNYQPIANRLVMLVTFPAIPPAENNRLIVFNGVQGVIANPATAPTNLLDPRFIVVETNCTMSSQVTWTYDGQYVMYGRLTNQPPPGGPASDLYSIRANSSTNTAVKFEVPGSISGGNKQWLCISPDGMKAAFTVDKQVYVIPLQFDNIAVTGAVVTNILTDASYTTVDVSGDAIPSNTVFSIVAPPSVDTNNFNGEFSGYVRQFSASGVSGQFDLLTNAAMTLHFSQEDIPSDASVTNLAIYVYNPQGTNAGQTGTWDKLDSVINTNLLTISAEVQHFSIYAIGRASAQSVTTVSVEGDIDGDRLADPYWPIKSNIPGQWTFWLSSGGYLPSGPYTMTVPGGEPVRVADFDGDGLADPVMVANGGWTFWFSSGGYLPSGPYLMSVSGGDPVGGDFDGDRLADPAMVANGAWTFWFSSGGYLPSGPYVMSVPGGEPVAGDFDGDRLADPTMVANGGWTFWFSSGGYLPSGPYVMSVAGTDVMPMTGDFDGDSLADPVMVVNNNWMLWLSSGGYLPSGPYVFIP